MHTGSGLLYYVNLCNSLLAIQKHLLNGQFHFGIFKDSDIFPYILTEKYISKMWEEK